jgi:hypothetical protein
MSSHGKIISIKKSDIPDLRKEIVDSCNLYNVYKTKNREKK